MKKITLFLLFVAFVLQSYSQRFNVFSADPTKTVSEMKEFFATAPKERQKEGDQLLTQFNLFWNAQSTINPELQEGFIGLANLMLKKNMHPFPQFQAFIKSYIAFFNSEFTSETEIWAAIVKYHIDHDASQFHNKMSIYQDFFSNNILQRTGLPMDALWIRRIGHG